MNLTPEQKELGRRNFLKAVAGTPALAALAAASAVKGPKSGGPVKAALIGTGDEGKVLLSQFQKSWIDVRALCDINPAQTAGAAEALTKLGYAKPTQYQDFKQMLEKEDLEAVVIATPLFTHADIAVACMEAGKHVLCEKMMAWDVPSAKRMLDASHKHKRVLEIGHQRFYNAAYQEAYEGLIKTGAIGDVHYVRTLWHRNKNWRRKKDQPSGFDPKAWGYEDWEHLVNWRLYPKFSRGLLAELGSHQIAIANWFYDAVPEAVFATGGIHRWKDEGRQVFDHVYATFEYPGGRTATFTSIESNGFDDNYEMIMGTKGTILFKGETEKYYFPEGTTDPKPNAIEVTKRGGDAIADASESRDADAKGGQSRTVASASGAPAAGGSAERRLAYRNEINAFCSAVRSGTPLLCGPERALGSAAACIRAYEAGEQKSRLTLKLA
jgi:predicted dehydrogenase